MSHYRIMNSRRYDWGIARDRIQARMAELRLSVVDLHLASGLSEKQIRTLLKDGPDMPMPRETTRWKLCDALHWSPDSIDRILEGLEPLEIDESGEISRLDLIDGRLSEMEAVASTGLGQLRNQQTELGKFYRLLTRLEDDVRSVRDQRDSSDALLHARLEAMERAIAELRQADRPGEPGPS